MTRPDPDARLRRLMPSAVLEVVVLAATAERCMTHDLPGLQRDCPSLVPEDLIRMHEVVKPVHGGET